MENTFRQFFDTYLEVWSSSSLAGLRGLISKDYKARKVNNGEIIGFDYEESILGWEQGFNFANENKAQWILNEISTFPLNNNETMVILSATIIVKCKTLNKANLFFQTFKRNNKGHWKLIRSYIEARILKANINQVLKEVGNNQF